MTSKAEWYEKHCPEYLSCLFDPASGDYLPRAIHVATSQDTFHTKYLEAYRELKKRYPSHINTKDPSENWVYYSGGDPQDYPND